MIELIEIFRNRQKNSFEKKFEKSFFVPENFFSNSLQILKN